MNPFPGESNLSNRAVTLLFSRLEPQTFPRILLEILRISQMDIVRRYGFTKADVSSCLRGKNRNAKIRQAVAKELGVSPEQIWKD